jgi:hypothetical protein
MLSIPQKKQFKQILYKHILNRWKDAAEFYDKHSDRIFI